MTTPRQLPCSSRGRLEGVRGGICSALVIGASTLFGCASAPPSAAELAYAQAMSPSVELATTRTEELALERAASLPVGEPVELEGGVVLAGPVYPAASGRRCRELRVGASHRLACEDRSADVWVFVPDVFAAGPHPATADTVDHEDAAAEPEASEDPS